MIVIYLRNVPCLFYYYDVSNNILQLHVLATSKGLVAGNLSFTNEEGVEVDCRLATEGESIPSNVEGLHNFRTDAKIILIVEKDAVFQTLLQDSSMQSSKIIFVTGKGVPDINTRQLIHRYFQYIIWRPQIGVLLKI